MFKIGDRVRHAARDVVGTVIEIDGATVYIEQDNGAEVDFPAAQLVLESAYQKSHDRGTRRDAGSPATDAAYASVIAGLFPAVIELGKRHHAALPRVPGVAPKAWEELSALQKLNAVSAATEVPVKAWIDAAAPGAKTPIGKLQIAVLAKAGGRR